jgi:exodeoxyribonuclease V gamma subunit
MRASGALPHGQVGECIFAGASDRVARFAGRLGRVLPRRDTQPLEVDVALGDFRLTGRLTGMTASGWVGYRLAKIKAADYLNLWLHHLALNVTAPEGVARQSYWVAEDYDVALDPVENAETSLKNLLDLYWWGSRRLLPFFPKSALAYVERLRKDQEQGKEPDLDRALWAARQVWEGSEQRAGSAERGDAYYQLAFGDADPLDGEFTALATAVFGPLFAVIDAES